MAIYGVNQSGGAPDTGAINTCLGIFFNTIKEFTHLLLVNAGNCNEFWRQIAKSTLDIGFALVIKKCIKCEALNKGEYWRVNIIENVVRKKIILLTLDPNSIKIPCLK
jgi:hypothetical protein